MILGRVELLLFRIELSEEAVDGDQRQRLARVGGVGQRLLGESARLFLVAIRMVVLCPAERAFSPAEHCARPLQPAIVCLQPGAGGGEVVGVEGDLGAQTLQCPGAPV